MYIVGKNITSLEDLAESVVLDKPRDGGVLGIVPNKQGGRLLYLYIVLGLCNYIHYTSKGQLALCETTQKKVPRDPKGPCRSL